MSFIINYNKYFKLKAELEGGTNKQCQKYNNETSCNNSEGCIWHRRKGKQKSCLVKGIKKLN